MRDEVMLKKAYSKDNFKLEIYIFFCPLALGLILGII